MCSVFNVQCILRIRSIWSRMFVTISISSETRAFSPSLSPSCSAFTYGVRVPKSTYSTLSVCVCGCLSTISVKPSIGQSLWFIFCATSGQREICSSKAIPLTCKRTQRDNHQWFCLNVVDTDILQLANRYKYILRIGSQMQVTSGKEDICLSIIIISIVYNTLRAIVQCVGRMAMVTTFVTRQMNNKRLTHCDECVCTRTALDVWTIQSMDFDNVAVTHSHFLLRSLSLTLIAVAAIVVVV